MNKCLFSLTASVIAPLLIPLCLHAQNPLIRDQFSADPSVRVFNDRVYLFPSHDILAKEGKGRPGWFCMEDYHVFSSSNLTDWTDHGVILTQNKVPWVKPDSYSMWAPDCIERNGKYYFYFPAPAADTASYGRGFSIGVAVADKPEGPYVPEPNPIKGIRGIDPNVFIDKDGQAYIYWSQGKIYGARLKENMAELASEVTEFTQLPEAGLKEGPYVFERKGLYYLTFPHVENKIERLEYAIGASPLGPFKMTGVIMDESESGCWTNHHSVVSFRGQWYLFYHDRDYSPQFDKARSVRADSLFFNNDGRIRKVVPTLRGVGVTSADARIQIDRFSARSKDAQVVFLDTANRFAGWKAVFPKPGSWVRYNTVDFKAGQAKEVSVRVHSAAGASLTIRANDASGPVVATVAIPGKNSWETVENRLSKVPQGVIHLFVELKSGSAEVDWISFR